MGKKTRGVADGGNVNRTIRNNCGPFVRFLKKNVQKARLERKVFNQIVSFVPYDDMYTAEDIARMSSAMKQILGWITAKNRPHAHPNGKEEKAEGGKGGKDGASEG
jgi:hypothetical protein